MRFSSVKFPYTHLIRFGKDQPRVEQRDLQILTNTRDCEGFYSTMPPALSLQRPSSKYLLPHPTWLQVLQMLERGRSEGYCFCFPVTDATVLCVLREGCSLRKSAGYDDSCSFDGYLHSRLPMLVLSS